MFFTMGNSTSNINNNDTNNLSASTTTAAASDHHEDDSYLVVVEDVDANSNTNTYASETIDANVDITTNAAFGYRRPTAASKTTIPLDASAATMIPTTGGNDDNYNNLATLSHSSPEISTAADILQMMQRYDEFVPKTSHPPIETTTTMMNVASLKDPPRAAFAENTNVFGVPYEVHLMAQPEEQRRPNNDDDMSYHLGDASTVESRVTIVEGSSSSNSSDKNNNNSDDMSLSFEVDDAASTVTEHLIKAMGDPVHNTNTTANVSTASEKQLFVNTDNVTINNSIPTTNATTANIMSTATDEQPSVTNNASSNSNDNDNVMKNTAEGMAGELGPNAFVTLGENLMRTSNISENNNNKTDQEQEPKEEATDSGTDKKEQEKSTNQLRQVVKGVLLKSPVMLLVLAFCTIFLAWKRTGRGMQPFSTATQKDQVVVVVVEGPFATTDSISEEKDQAVVEVPLLAPKNETVSEKDQVDLEAPSTTQNESREEGNGDMLAMEEEDKEMLEDMLAMEEDEETLDEMCNTTMGAIPSDEDHLNVFGSVFGFETEKDFAEWIVNWFDFETKHDAPAFVPTTPTRSNEPELLDQMQDQIMSLEALPVGEKSSGGMFCYFMEELCDWRSYQIASFLFSLPTFCRAMTGLVVILSLCLFACTVTTIRPGQESKTHRGNVNVKVLPGVHKLDLTNYERHTVVELKDLLRARHCPVSAPRKLILIERLVQNYREELDGLTYRELRARLSAQGLKQAGTKEEYIVRLLEAGL